MQMLKQEACWSRR